MSQTEVESRELERDMVVIQTKGRNIGKIGIVTWVIGSGEDAEVRITWATLRSAIPMWTEFDDYTLVSLPKGRRQSGTAKPSTLKRYGLQMLTREQVEAIRMRDREIQQLPWDEQHEAQVDLLTEFADRAHDLDLDI